jgi:hypothetical protein
LLDGIARAIAFRLDGHNSYGFAIPKGCRHVRTESTGFAR